MWNNWIWVVGLLWLLGLWGWRVVNWVWVRPKKLEKFLRQQGLAGNSYRFLLGDTKEIAAAVHQARSQPMTFSHDIAPRATPTSHTTIHKYGTSSHLILSLCLRRPSRDSIMDFCFGLDINFGIGMSSCAHLFWLFVLVGIPW